MVKGYKALDINMRAVNGNGMQYEMGKLYSIEGKVVPCYKGFHFCKSIEAINGYYSIKDSRIFEVEADGEIIDCAGKYAAEKIMLVRELTQEEISDYFRQNQKEFAKSEVWYIRYAVAAQGYGLDILVYDKDYSIRIAVAKQGYGLDILVHDKDPNVRIAVAEQGYGLDRLINDENWQVRTAVARQGYGLAILINDEDSDVRRAVAKQGYGLDRLINDWNWQVRTAVAEQGYGLDILINDKNGFVRSAVAGQGYGLDKLINVRSSFVKCMAQKMLKSVK